MTVPRSQIHALVLRAFVKMELIHTLAGVLQKESVKISTEITVQVTIPSLTFYIFVTINFFLSVFHGLCYYRQTKMIP